MGRIVRLDGEWLIACDPDNLGRDRGWAREPVPEAVTTRVPGIIQEPFPGYHGVVWYWREFVPPAPLPHGRMLLRFGAVDYRAEVWLNGVAVGGHEGGETPFVLDVTRAIEAGRRNRLAVRVLNPTHERIDGVVLEETPHRNKVIPHGCGSGYNYGGILGPVEAMAVPSVRIEDLFARADPRTGAIRIRVSLCNASRRPIRGRLRLTAGPAASGETLAEASQEAEGVRGDTAVDAALHIDDPRPWDLDAPFLYRVTARLETDEPDGADEVSVRCGFREFVVERGFFRLNGRRVFAKSTHTGNHCPIGQVLAPPAALDLLRRDLLYAKASGYNMVRFISGMPHPWQLDLCDEIGLMVYEESLAAWCLADSPAMADRFDRAVYEMIRRDRNHPSVVIWGLLNETPDGPVFRHAVESLPLVRSLDGSRLVLLGSGRWDNRPEIGSFSNPGSLDWEYGWGTEGPGAPPVAPVRVRGAEINRGMGDVHCYPGVPQTDEANALLRTLGDADRPVFLSEYGIGSLLNAVRELRQYEQSGENPHGEDAAFMRSMAERFIADWERYGLDGAYAFPEDALRESQRLHGRQRLLGFDLIRSNPGLCGFNLTGMLDHAMTGEGVWSFWREWKPGAFDALSDGWAPVRWCLFVTPLHTYAGRPITVEAVLANEDVLRPGDYPAWLRIMGPEGVVWQRRCTARVPAIEAGRDGPLAIPVLREDVTIEGPAGSYELAATVERGAAPAGGRLRFTVSDVADLPRIDGPITLRGVSPEVEAWLRGRGIEVVPFESGPTGTREAILVGDAPSLANDGQGWRDLAERLSRGSIAVFVSPDAFRKDTGDADGGVDPVGWLPLAEKGRCEPFWDWLYHRECVAKPGPLFEGLPARGVLDWDVFGPVIPRRFFAGGELPEEVAAATFAVGYPCEGGYASGIVAGIHRFGDGRFVTSTFEVLENLDRHPAADRLLLNMLLYAARSAGSPPEPLRPDFEARLRAIGFLPAGGRE